jgi:predicted transcriptional regulator
MTPLLQSGSICFVALAIVSAVPADDQVGQPPADDTATELSVPPLDHVVYPDDRPSWLNQVPDLESRIHTWVVVTSPKDTKQECADELGILQRAAVSSYIRELTGSDDVDFYPVNDKWIESQLVIKSYQGSVTEGDLPMVEQAVMLEFTPRNQQEILKAWKNIQVRERLGSLGVVVFFGLVLLMGSSTLLGAVGRRLDHRLPAPNRWSD